MVITSRQNGVVKRLRALSKDRHERHKAGEFVCDGEKLFFEALSSGAELVTVLCNEKFSEKIPQGLSADVYVATDDVLGSITTLKEAQNVIFSCRIKKAETSAFEKIIILDRLQDTGNIGTIIRTADAFGIDAIFEDGCADIYNPKTIRAAMGSVFRVPVISCDCISAISELRSRGIEVYASELYGETKSISEISLRKAAVVIGNEGNGVRREVAERCSASAIIPMYGKAESLNAAVAASIFMYKMSEEE